MNVCKLIGVILVISSCTGLGFLKCQIMKQRKKDLENYYRMLVMLKGEISYSLDNLERSLNKISEKDIGCFGTIIQNVSRKLRSNTSGTICEIWEEEIENAGILNLNQEDKEIMKELGENLGNLDKKMQISIIELNMEKISQQITQAKDDEEHNSRVYKGLGIISGVFIAIILL